MKEKISDYFSRTFVDEWSFNWNGVYRSFFVTSKDETHRSYLTSTWNA
ncbi:MAG: hypothetical protein LBF15_04245 [Candidatus Peribacteria bacterium]|nr:hypothetical protein [Candidatus Peribacteria bacterium]